MTNRYAKRGDLHHMFQVLSNAIAKDVSRIYATLEAASTLASA